jgi:prepilin-type N-terminal cleavage/methylation domain-containing protein
MSTSTRQLTSETWLRRRRKSSSGFNYVGAASRAAHPQRPPRLGGPTALRGFTLVELLVVIAILGTLFGILAPAIQQAREASRRTQCQNNLRELAFGLLSYHDVFKSFPYGGWGHEWVGMPDHRHGWRQPGGWAFSLLPFLEESALQNLGAGFSGAVADELYSQRLQTPLAVFNCVSRRPCAAWPIADRYAYVRMPKPFGRPSVVARSDYAINGGASHVYRFNGPPDLTRGSDADYWTKAPVPAKFSGISHLRTAIALRSITDGTSNTYLVGEKYIDQYSYTNGESVGDSASLYAGYCTDLHRFTGGVENVKHALEPFAAPLHDYDNSTAGISATYRFGSAHPAGFSMVYCDGSVDFLSFEIDPEVHLRSGHARDEDNPLSSL